MTNYVFRSAPDVRHRVLKRGDHVLVDDTVQPVRLLDAGHCIARIDGRSAHVRVAAHGDAIHLHLGGRTCVIDRVDATRSVANGAASEQGHAKAPMPGVVVNWLATPGHEVRAGDALLVIESMKLQMTIDAPHGGWLDELPFREGQSFNRGDVLARVRAVEVEA